jgi:hypothetical protein
MSKRTFSLFSLIAPLGFCAICLTTATYSVSASAQSSKQNPSNEVAPARTSDIKSINNTKADANELTYVANAENCSAKALHLSSDHGLRAATTSWLNDRRIAECFSRVR